MRISSRQLCLYTSEYLKLKPLPQPRPAARVGNSQPMSALFAPSLYHPGHGPAQPSAHPGFLLDRYI